MILGIAHDDDAASTGFDLVALRDALRRVVRALSMKVRTDLANNGAHVVFWKDYDGVNVGQRGENLRTFFGRHHGSPFAFQGTHGRIGVYRDNQFAAEFVRRVQVAHMADMQQIETSVGQGHAIPGAAPIRHTLLQLVARNNLPME